MYEKKIILEFFCHFVLQINVGNAVIGRLRLGNTSVPTMALIVVDLPAFIVPTTASTISLLVNFFCSPTNTSICFLYLQY